MRHRAIFLGTGVLWLGASWMVALAAERFDLLWTLPPLVLLLTASLLRNGRTLLDRLMVALMLLIGAVCLSGFAYTLVPGFVSRGVLCGAALSVLGLFHALSGRVPKLPRPALTDVLPVIGALAVIAVPLIRYAGSDLQGRVALWLIGVEGTHHFSAFDAISRTGDYLYWRSVDSMPEVNAHMLSVAQGWHFTAAFLDGFLPGSAPSFPFESLDRYVFWSFAGFALMIAAILWSALSIAGQSLRRGQQAVLAVVMVCFIAVTDLPGMLVYGYPAEALGLALLAGLLVLLLRDGATSRENLAAIAVVLVAIGLTYLFLLAAAAAAVAVWGYLHRRQLPLPTTAACGALAAALAPLAVIAGIRDSGEIATSLEIGLTIHPSHVTWINAVIVAGLVCAAMLSPAGRSQPFWRRYVPIAAAVTIIVALTFAYHLVAFDEGGYYMARTVRAGTVMLLAAAGVALATVRAVNTDRARAGLRYLRHNAHLGLLALAVVIAGGLAFGTSDYRRSLTSRNANPLVMWSIGDKQRTNLADAGLVLRIAAETPADGRTTIVLADKSVATFTLTTYVAAVQGRLGKLTPLLDVKARNDFELAESIDRAAPMVARLPGPLRLAVIGPRAVEVGAELVRINPEIELSVVPNERYGCDYVREVREPNASTCP